MNLIGKKIILRAMTMDDMQLYLEMINDPDIETYVGGWSFPVSMEKQGDWFQRTKDDENNIRLTIEFSGKAVGMISLCNVDWKNGVAFSGVKLSKGTTKQIGIGTDAVMTFTKYAFDELRLNRIETTILEYNTCSLKLYEKCGWKEEGIRRDSLYRNGNFYDEKYFGIIRKDFEVIREKLNY